MKIDKQRLQLLSVKSLSKLQKEGMKVTDITQCPDARRCARGSDD